MWNVNGKPVSVAWLNPEPVQVLYDFDGPRIFTCCDKKDDQYLAYQCGEESGICRFLIVPFSQYDESKLTQGHTNLWEALSQSRSWIVDLDIDWQVSNAWEVSIDSLPRDVLPKPGVMLWRHLIPVIRPLTPRSASSQVKLPSPHFQRPAGSAILITTLGG